MLKELKKTIFVALTNAKFNVVDSWRFDEEEKPVLSLRLSNYSHTNYLDHNLGIANFVIDVFSDYPGEEEIMELEPKLTKVIMQVANDTPYIMGQMLKTMRIIDDKEQGPIQKHGIFVYTFILAEGEEIVEEEEKP